MEIDDSVSRLKDLKEQLEQNPSKEVMILIEQELESLRVIISQQENYKCTGRIL